MIYKLDCHHSIHTHRVLLNAIWTSVDTDIIASGLTCCVLKSLCALRENAWITASTRPNLQHDNR